MKKDPVQQIVNLIDQLDSVQSEKVLKSLSLQVSLKTQRPKLPPNVMVFQTAAYVCARELRPASNKILMYFLALSAYENGVSMDIKTIMEDLKMAKGTVITALKELEENNVILKGIHKKDRRRHEYFLSPVGAWKGNSVQRNKLLAKMVKEDANQLGLFGEQFDDVIERESAEIRNVQTPIDSANQIMANRQEKALHLLQNIEIEEQEEG